MRFYVLVLCFWLCVPRMARACLHWDGEPSPTPTTPSVVVALNDRVSRETWAARADEQKKRLESQEWNFATQNNLAVALAHAGQLDEALHRLITVEGAFPGHYYTAYNLGTVYELRGDLPSALDWTQKGIERELTMTGHSPLDGTEWLHLRILEAEIALQKSPDWLNSHSVSGLDFGAGRSVTPPTQFPAGINRQTLSIAEVQRSLFEQLHERLEFVPSPNPVVGSLLGDLGSVVAIESQKSAGDDDDTQSVRQKDAADLFKMALSFQAPHPALLQHRFDYYAGTPPYLLYVFFLALSSCGALFYGYQRLQSARREWEAEQERFMEAPPKFQTACIEWKDYDPNVPRDQPQE